MRKTLLTVAGFDPSGGAGIILDIKVFELLGFQGLSIITSNTVQNTKNVKKFFPQKSEVIVEQFETLREDIKIEGIKVGMIGGAENLSAVEYILNSLKNVPRVVDPVFKSSSGEWLIEKKAIEEYKEKIIPLSEIITPNILEASLITQIEIKNLDDIKKAAEQIFTKWKVKSIIKGGHLDSENAVDVAYDGNEFYFLEKNKVKEKVHGTGCFFSSALLGFLCKNNSFPEACKLAKEITYQAIKNSKKIGKGQRIIDFKSLKI